MDKAEADYRIKLAFFDASKRLARQALADKDMKAFLSIKSLEHDFRRGDPILEAAFDEAYADMWESGAKLVEKFRQDRLM